MKKLIGWLLRDRFFGISSSLITINGRLSDLEEECRMLEKDVASLKNDCKYQTQRIDACVGHINALMDHLGVTSTNTMVPDPTSELARMPHMISKTVIVKVKKR